MTRRKHHINCFWVLLIAEFNRLFEQENCVVTVRQTCSTYGSKELRAMLIRTDYACGEISDVVARLAAHAVSDGLMEGVQGGNILHGAVVGLISAGNGELMAAYGGSLKAGGQLAVQCVVGGTISELGGGNFANGAITAAFSFMFNHTMHERAIRKQQIEEDGRLSFGEALEWYKIGNGEELTVDANKMDLDQFIEPECFIEGRRTAIQLYPTGYTSSQNLSDSQIIQGLIYGSITIEYKGNGLFKLLPDTYDFDWHSNPNNNIKVWTRNILTKCAHLLHGAGKPYQIFFQGFYNYKNPIPKR